MITRTDPVIHWIDMVKLCQGFLGEGQEVDKVINYFRKYQGFEDKNSRVSMMTRHKLE